MDAKGRDMKFTGTGMRNELNFCMEAFLVKERFLTDEDPTVVIGKAIEAIQSHLSAVQKAYNDGSSDRNAISSEVSGHFVEIASIANEAASVLQSASEPEDNNRSI
jgi:hypothetical protein